MRNAAIAYYRVSTAKQGASGLGLDSQREAVQRYCIDNNWRVLAEFTEIESGRRNDRPEFEQALAAARLHRAPIIVAKVDRLTRSVAFLSRLLESGVDVRFADLPALEGPTGRFMLQQMAAVAEPEAGLISTRTRAALNAAKARGIRLGGNRGGTLSESARAEGQAARVRIAQQRAADLQPLLERLATEGVVSASAVARALMDRGVPSPTGRSFWSASQVNRARARLLP